MRYGPEASLEEEMSEQENVERKREMEIRGTGERVIKAHLVGVCSGWLAAWPGVLGEREGVGL